VREDEDVNKEGASLAIVRYRSTVAEEPTPALDEVILRAASRRAVRVRTIRRSIAALGLVAVLALPFWRAPSTREPEVGAARDYGRQEGATRYYLSNVASFTGPGSMEHKQ